MSEYYVQQMIGEAVTTWTVVRAGTPEEAAREGTGREVKARTAENIWIRVTDEDLRQVYEFLLRTTDHGHSQSIRHVGCYLLIDIACRKRMRVAQCLTTSHISS